MYKEKIGVKEKLKAVETYENGKMSLGEIIAVYRISKSTFQSWLRNYKVFGREGLLPKGKQKAYSRELKIAAVQEYLSGGSSQADICRKYKIYSRKQLRNWIKQYNGHKEMRPSRGRGSEIYMTSGRKTTYEERVKIVSYCIESGNDYTAAPTSARRAFTCPAPH